MIKLAYLIILPLIAAYAVIGFFCMNILLYALIGTSIPEASFEDPFPVETVVELSLLNGY